MLQAIGNLLNNLLSQMKRGIGFSRQMSTLYHVECHDIHGNLKWSADFHNLVVNAGLDDSLDKHFKASAYTAAWYVGLTTGTPTFAAADVMSSHGGWTEYTTYSEANRQTLTLGTVSGQSVDNSASKATFSINGGGGTIGGAFLVTNNTKGGTTGILYGGGAFSGGNRSVIAGDTVTVTATLTAAAA